MNNYKKLYKDKLQELIVITTIAIITIVFCMIVIIKQNNQIKTQAEYIESQEWQEYVELDTQRESEHMNMLEEMRKGNE